MANLAKIYLLFIISLMLGKLNSQENIEKFKEQVDAVCEEPEKKNYPRTTLAYITPWNFNGMELALKYSEKFELVSPCWFDIKPETLHGQFNSKIEGADHVNTNFMSEMREKKSSVKILPRFRCEGFTVETYQEWLRENNVNHFIKVLMRRLKYNKLNGLVLECNHIWINENLYTDYAIMIRKLYEALKKEKMSLVVTIFPYSESFSNSLNKMRFEYLSKYVDYFNVMTYDYLSYTKQESTNVSNLLIAPLKWVKNTIETYIDQSKANKDAINQKLLLGLPFHGLIAKINDQNPQLNILDSPTLTSMVYGGQLEGLEWNKDEAEHKIIFKSNDQGSIAVYPTKKFFKARLELTKQYNLGGVAIWDIAQGLESFLDDF